MKTIMNNKFQQSNNRDSTGNLTQTYNRKVTNCPNCGTALVYKNNKAMRSCDDYMFTLKQK